MVVQNKERQKSMSNILLLEDDLSLINGLSFAFKKLRVSYNKLWKLLIDKNMKKGELREAIGASKSTFAKLGKNQNVTLPVLLSICKYLKCDFGDIMEALPDDVDKERES